MNIPSNQKKQNIILVLILLMGAGLRCWNIGWGLPEIFEEATPFTVSWRFWHQGTAGLDVNPHFFNYPAFTFYLNFALQALHYGIGHLAGSYPDLSAFLHAYDADPTTFIVISRLVSVCFDVGTIVMMYVFATKYLGRAGALLPAMLLALNPLMIRNSHLINVDTPLVFFCLVSLTAAQKITTSPGWKWYLLAGGSIGFAAATKYNGAFLLPVLVLAHILRTTSTRGAARSLFDLRLMTACGIAVALFFVMNPYVVLSSAEFLRDFSFEEAHMASGHLGIDATQSTAGYYLFAVFPAAFGIVCWTIIVLSFCTILLRRNKEELFLLAFPLLYLAVIMSWKMRAERYVLPVIPYLVIIGSSGILLFLRTLRQSNAILAQRLSSPVTRKVIHVLLVLLLLAQPVAAVITYQSSLSLPDTRAIAKEWIIGHVPRGGVIVTPPFGLALPDSMYRVFPMPFLSVNAERVAPFYDTRWFDDFDLVVGSDFDYNRYVRDTTRYRDFIAYYDALRSRYSLVHAESPMDQQPGPALWLFTPPATKHTVFDADLFGKLQTMPESVWVSRFLKNLAILLMEKKNYAKSEQVALAILKVEDANIDALRVLADARENLGRNGEMIPLLDSLIAKHPESGALTDLKGTLLLRRQRER